MPPTAVKTIKDLIYWEYAKLISESALHDRKNYGFIMHESTLKRYIFFTGFPLSRE